MDEKWLDALRAYWGGGIVPTFKNGDGSIDAQRTVDTLMRAVGAKKLGTNGEPLEWPSN